MSGEVLPDATSDKGELRSRAVGTAAARSAVVGEQQKDTKQALKEHGEDGPLCPLLDKKSVREYLIPLSTAAFLGITAINVLTSNQGQDPLAEKAKHKVLRMFLLVMPYSLFSVGLAGLAAAMAATRRPRLLGCASGFLLGELVYLVAVGTVVTIVRVDPGKNIVWPVTAGILVALMVIWAMMCAYPECLRCFLGRVLCCCRCCCRACAKAPAVKDTPKKCKTCDAVLVNGKSPTPAPAGAAPCPTCGGIAGNALSPPTPSGMENC